MVNVHARKKRRKKQGVSGMLLVGVFGLLFAGVGTALFFFFTVMPLWQIYEAQGWFAHPCTITQSRVERHQGEDNDTFSIEIRYRYEYEGSTYTGDTYRFAPPGSSSGQTGKQRVVDAHPVGSEQTCYVDPDDPAESVINRGLTHGLWLGLFPIPFMAVGYGVLIAAALGKIKIGGRGNKWRPDAAGKSGDDSMPVGETTAGPITLHPGKARRKKFIGLAIFAVIWTGLVATLFYLKLGDNDFNIPWPFPIVFGVVGLVIIGAAVQSMLLLFAPAVVIEVDRLTLPLGGSTRLSWHLGGKARKINRITIVLIGEESATYRRGTDTITDKHTFCELTVVGQAGEDQKMDEYRVAAVAMQGEEVLTVPLNQMHSFEAKNNKIHWRLRVTLDVPGWPDPKDEYDLTVLPVEITR